MKYFVIAVCSVFRGLDDIEVGLPDGEEDELRVSEEGVSDVRVSCGASESRISGVAGIL